MPTVRAWSRSATSRRVTGCRANALSRPPSAAALVVALADAGLARHRGRVVRVPAEPCHRWPARTRWCAISVHAARPVGGHSCRTAAASSSRARTASSALTLTISASDGYSQKNVNRSTDEAIAGLTDIVAAAEGTELDAVVSCAFGSPFEDVTVGSVADVVDRVRSSGRPPRDARRHHGRGDTSSRSVSCWPRSRRRRPAPSRHRGTALANALAGLDAGSDAIRHLGRRPRRLAFRSWRGRQPGDRRPRPRPRGQRHRHRRRPRLRSSTSRSTSATWWATPSPAAPAAARCRASTD